MPALGNPRWERFCQLRHLGKAPNESYIEAGFKKNKSGLSLLQRKPEVVSRILELGEADRAEARKAALSATERLGIDKFWVLERYKYAAEAGLRGHPIYDHEGKPTGRYGKPDITGANQALKMIGLELGMGIERLEIGGAGEFAAMNDRELGERIIEDAKAIGLDEAAVETLLLTFQPGEAAE